MHNLATNLLLGPMLTLMSWSLHAATSLTTEDGLSLTIAENGAISRAAIDAHDTATASGSGGFAIHDWQSGETRPVLGALRPEGDAVVFSGGLQDAKLALDARFTTAPDHIACEGRIVDQRRTDDRAVDLMFRLPFGRGRTEWWPDICGPIDVSGQQAKAVPGTPQSVLTFAPVTASRFRLYQPRGGGCPQRPNTLWLAELEAYGVDLNEDLLEPNTLKKLSSDSNSGSYRIDRVVDGTRNDAWEPKWLKRGWASANSAAPHWVELDFGKETTLARLDVYWCRERFGFAASREFRLEHWDGQIWGQVNARVSHEAPRLGDAEKAQFGARQSGAYTDVYPFGCVAERMPEFGLGIALPPSAPCVFRIGYDAPARALVLTLKFGLSTRPMADTLRSQAPFSFVIYRVDPVWGFRDAARRYYALFPRMFRRNTTLDGLWLLGNPLKIPNPHHYAYHEHGERSAAIDEMWGIKTCPYVLVGQREFATETADPQAALAELATLDPDLKSFYGKGLREVIHNCAVYRANGKPAILMRRRGGSLNGPKVATFPMNPDPSLYAGTGKRTAGRQTVDYAALMLERTPAIDGIYVDSLSSWGGYLNPRRDHFAFVDLPLTHNKRGHVAIDNALAHIEFLRVLRNAMPGPEKILFGNGIRKRRAWAGFHCDVLGVEANRSVHKDASHYAFFRTIAYHKPFLLLYYYSYPKMDLPRAGVSEYIQSAVAFGIAPETRPFGKERERDVDLYDTFIPILRNLGRAGWEPIPHATCSDPEMWLERFGTGDANGLFLTVYNPTDTERTPAISLDFAALKQPAGIGISEVVTGKEYGIGNTVTLPVPPKSLRVLQVGPAPPPPALPVLDSAATLGKLVELREKRWAGAGSLLMNGSFEELNRNGLPNSWRVTKGGTGELTVAAKGARTGTHCLRFHDNGDTSHANIAQAFDYLQPGYEYEFGAWVRQEADSPGPGRLYFQWRNDEGKISDGRVLFPQSTTWVSVEKTFRPPAGATRFNVSLGCSMRESTDLWLDDVSLTRRVVKTVD